MQKLVRHVYSVRSRGPHIFWKIPPCDGFMTNGNLMTNVDSIVRFTQPSYIYSVPILCMGSANERGRYIVTPPLIGWAHTQNIDELMQERRNPSVLAMELRLSCIDPSILTLHAKRVHFTFKGMSACGLQFVFIYNSQTIWIEDWYVNT